jgi:hypothetical protein
LDILPLNIKKIQEIYLNTLKKDKLAYSHIIYIYLEISDI